MPLQAAGLSHTTSELFIKGSIYDKRVCKKKKGKGKTGISRIVWRSAGAAEERGEEEQKEGFKERSDLVWVRLKAAG